MATRREKVIPAATEPSMDMNERIVGMKKYLAKGSVNFTDPDQDCIRKFDSLDKFVAFSQLPTDLPKNKMSSIINDDQFAGCSMEEALRLAAKGWKEGAAELVQMKTSFGYGKSKIKDTYWDVAPGTWCDPLKLMTGTPDIWECEAEEGVEEYSRAIKIIVHLTATNRTSKEAIKRRGAVIASIIESLEMNGTRVELVIIHLVGSDIKLFYETRLKKHSERLEIEKIAFCMAHSAFLRRITFAAVERECPEIRKKYGAYKGGGYGSCKNLPANKIKPGDLYFPFMLDDSGYKSNEEARKTIENILETTKQGAK